MTIGERSIEGMKLRFAEVLLLQLMLQQHESCSVWVAQKSSRKTNGCLDDGREFPETALTFHTRVTKAKLIASDMIMAGDGCTSKSSRKSLEGDRNAPKTKERVYYVSHDLVTSNKLGRNRHPHHKRSFLHDM
jgi:hypothetical protein